MRKKFTTLLTLLVVVAMVLSGCGKEKAGENETSQNEARYSMEEEESNSQIVAEKTDSSRFYYSQLTDEAQKMYEAILEAKEQLINNEPVVVYTYTNEDDIDYDFVGEQVSLHIMLA